MDETTNWEWSCDHDASTSLNLVPINISGILRQKTRWNMWALQSSCSEISSRRSSMAQRPHGPREQQYLLAVHVLKQLHHDFLVNSEHIWLGQLGQLVCFGDFHLYKGQNLSTQCSPCWIGAWRNALCRVALVRSSWLVKGTSKWPVPQTCGSFPGVFPAMTTSNRPINWCHVPPTEPKQRGRLDSVRKKLVPCGHPMDTLFPIP